MKTNYQAELLFNRLTNRFRHLKKWARRTGTNAFRLYDRDIPEIPLVLDLYDDAVSGALYKSPAGSGPGEENDSEENAWLLAMKASAAKALNIPESHIFIKERQRFSRRQDSGDQYNRVARQNFYRDVKEGDMGFRVNLSDYLDTGLFLDARKKRALLRGEAEGKRVLNLFAYTCSLSAAAAKGGARQVDSVDLSNTYLDWGKINFALNKLPAAEKFSFIQSDVMQFIAQAAQNRSRWNIIILDPPSFSNSKRTAAAFDVKRDHRQLIQRCLPLLSPGGTLMFSSNAKGFTIDEKDFPGFIVKDIGKELVDEDFRGKRIPVCYALRKA